MAMEMTSLLNWLGWAAAAIALLNLVAIVSLVVAYAWHHGLKPKLRRRRARQRSFDRLLSQSSLDSLSAISEPSYAGEWWEW